MDHTRGQSQQAASVANVRLNPPGSLGGTKYRLHLGPEATLMKAGGITGSMKPCATYPCEFTNIHAFIQRVALDMVRYGYLYYVTGRVPEGRDPCEVDRKLLERYDITVSKYVRCRRKAKGRANVHYARHQDFLVMLASVGGDHEWFTAEEWADEHQVRRHGRKIRYVPRQPIVHGGYSIGYKHSTSTGRGHVSIRIHPQEYQAIKAYFLDIALHRSAEALAQEFAQFPFEPYKLIRSQRWNILQAVNAKRKRANFELVEANREVLRKQRRVYRYLKEAA